MSVVVEYMVRVVVFISIIFLVSSCGFFSGLTKPSAVRDSAPNVTLDPKKIKNAVPRVEAKSKGGNHSPYRVLGKKYRVMKSAKGFKQRGEASWYGKKFHGRLTSNGERYDMYAMTAAHKQLPLPTYVTVKNLETNKSIIVRVNDRGPFHGGRIIDLSYAAASKLGMLKKGTARVEITVINPKQWSKSSKKNHDVIKPLDSNGTPDTKKISAQKVAKIAPTGKKILVNGKRLYLQVVAYQSLSSAQATQNRLLDSMRHTPTAYNVVIHPSDHENTVYRVRIGPLSTRAELEKIKQRASLQSFGTMHSIWE